MTGAQGDREAASGHLRAQGLPTRRLEAWHFTSLAPLADVAFSAGAQASARAATLLQGCGIDALAVMNRVVFVNGRFDAGLSRLPDGVGLSFFADEPAFGAIARPERDAATMLNTILAEDGARIDVAADVDAGTIAIVSVGVATDTPVSFHPRHRIVLQRGARLALFEYALGEGEYLHNPVAEIVVSADAVLTHVKFQDEAPGARHITCAYVDVAERGEYDSFTLTVGGSLARHEVHVGLLGGAAAAHVNAAQLLDGAQHADLTSVITHGAPGCVSRQTVKNVLSGRAHGVFQGKIYVDRVAQKTDGYQMNQALLLSDGAQIDAKPELEIYADDVKCSHGATVGALDDEQLFYLRSRGIPDAEARAILVRAFLLDAVELVREPTLRGILDDAVERHWRKGA
nr:Fe-S cluster assembly protein SufD [Ameyamaea chiangmaiensis]